MTTSFNGHKCLPGGLIAQCIDMLEDSIVIQACSAMEANLCPRRGQRSRRRHGYYQRKLVDLPAHGRKVRIDLTDRRYRCAAPACVVGMESRGGAHDWAKMLADLAHEVRLMSPLFVEPYVKSNKSDRDDAEAICEGQETLAQPSIDPLD